MKFIRFSDGGVLAFLRSWNLEAVAALQQTFLLSLAPMPLVGELIKVCMGLGQIFNAMNVIP